MALAGAIVAGMLPAAAWSQGVIHRLDGQDVPAAQAHSIAAAELQADGVTGAEIAILNNGHVVWSDAFGLRDVQNNLPMTPDTNTWAASITKAVFSTWVMQQVGEHRMVLDVPVAGLLPQPLNEYERYHNTAAALVKDPRWQLVTPRMVLSHTAGFANFAELEPDKEMHIHFKPGTRFAYSGDGMNLLQFLMEQELDMTLDKAMDHDIFEPLHMRQTALVAQPWFAENAALRYDAQGKLLGRTYRTEPRAAGSMTTSAHDLGLFLEALLAHRIVSAATEREIFTPQIQIHAAHQFPSLENAKGTGEDERLGLSYGLGWGLLTHTPYGPAFFKEGHGDGAENYVVCFTKHDDCMVILTNSDNGELAFRPLLEKLFGDTAVPWEWEGYTRAQVLGNEEHSAAK